MSNIQKAGYIALIAVGLIWFVFGAVTINACYVLGGIAYVVLAFLCWSKHKDAIDYEKLYYETNEIAGELHNLATDAIKHADEVLDSNKKLIKDLEDRGFLIDLFLDDIDDEIADVLNEQIKDRGMVIRFYEGKWRLFVKRDE